MASSRLEKIGTIFTRVNGLLKSGAMKWEDRPLWYDLYNTFPPKDEPRYDRPAPDIPVRGIFYEEDKIRAQLHKNMKNLGTVNLFNNESQTKTKRFVEIYQKLEATGSVPQEELYKNAVEMLSRDVEVVEGKEESLVNTFKEAQNEKLKVDVAKIFKE